MSTVLNTAAKVKAEFGGTTWTQISGRFLLAANSTYAVKSTGGTTTHVHTTGNHTLTTSEIPAHTHGSKTLTGSFNSHQLGPSTSELYYLLYNKSGIVNIATDSSSKVNSLNTTGAANANSQKITITATHTHDSVGSGGAHNHGNTGSSNTFPAYYAVYIWERTA